MVKVKMGAIVKEIPNGALKWYEMAGWKVIKEKKNETNSKKTTTTSSKI